MSRVEQVLSCAGITFTGTNTPSYEENTAIKAAVAASHKTHLLGHNAREKLEVDMWLTFSANAMNKDLLSALNSTLLYKTFLVGCSFSLADIAVHVAVASTSRNGFANICRWDNHIRNFLFQPCGEVQMASSSSATFVPVAVMDSVYAASKAAPTAAPADKKQKTDKKDSAAPKEAVKEEPAAAGENALDPSKLDIRCGLVVKCWNHPDSDKLLCEEIDVGGGEIRTIASGLRAFYTAEQVQGRKVVVLANLKERSMAGFKSQVLTLLLLQSLFVLMYMEYVLTLSYSLTLLGYGVMRGEQRPQRGEAARGP